jgi:hypothetical protein
MDEGIESIGEENPMGKQALVVAVAVFLSMAPARADVFTAGSFSAYGDFRLRAETDWDSEDASGVMREDRTRLRVRLRAGFRFDPTESVQLGARLRGGQEGSQQSPHITIIDFQDNDTGDTSFDFDRWYVLGKVHGLEVWAGRNDLPFWKQDELLFDDDVTMPGIAFRWVSDLGPGKFSLAGGYFTPPVGMTRYSGALTGAQASYEPKLGRVQLALAGGVYLFDGNPDDPDVGALLQGNGSRDYSILAASFQARRSVGDRPLKLGVDLLRNTQNYDPNDSDPITAANFDEKDGYVLMGEYGLLKEHNDWLVGYYYAHIETFAVNSSFGQDDWVRWGNATQTRASNMKGHEFRFGWAINARMNMVVRLYLADAITTVEDGKRFRIDFNYKF